MKSTAIGFFWAGLFLVSALSGQGVRKAVWAGQFYDLDAPRLAARIDGLLAEAPAEPAVSGEIEALIVPHAGYVFSGRTAASAYKRVLDGGYETIVVIGPAHRYGFRGCSIYPKGGFETPLGTAAVDEALASALMKASGYGFVPEAHREEHSVEVQVPFIQRVLPEAKILPIVMGIPDMKTVRKLASALVRTCAGKKILIIASTDMSHFLAKTEANSEDAKTIDLIRALDAETIMKKMEAGENILCGGAAVAAAILYARGLGPVRAEILGYADSSEASGDESRVVGYAAAALSSDRNEPAPAFELTPDEKNELLDLARTAVEAYVRNGSVIESAPRNAALLAQRGAFVTLSIRGGLRGCIGFIAPVLPLHRAVVQAAIYAAVEDRRFDPVSAEELGRLDYEISVLASPEDISDPSRIRIGTHGLIIEKDGRKGVLLPQVAVENGWNRGRFLEEICLKAGLPPNAWKKGAKLQTFEAVVFR
jgi:MEMO1 family protein